MIKISKYKSKRGWKKEHKEWNEKTSNSISKNEIKYMIKKSIKDWINTEWLFDGRGHEVFQPKKLLECNVPKEIVNFVTNRYYGFIFSTFSSKYTSLYGWDEELKERRPLLPNEYIDGIDKNDFVSLIVSSLGLKHSSELGRGSSCREESQTIKNYLNS